MPRLGTLLLAALASVLLLIASMVPAQAATASWSGVITFHKNYDNPQNSMLSWRLYKITNGKRVLTDKAAWRTGAGMGGKRGTNSCINDVGWLPNGTYRLKHHANYRGNLIKGRAFQLDDKRCPNGNRRFALFIHTEQGANNTQCADRRGDQICRWEFPRYNDYKSAGCIKLSPGDLRDLSNRYLSRFRSGVRYGTSSVVLRVVDAQYGSTRYGA